MLFSGMSGLMFGQETTKSAITLPTDNISAEDVVIKFTPTPPTKWQQVVNWFSDMPFLIVPSISTSPETNWAFGAAGAYYFTAKGESKLSDIGFDAAYSLNHQWNVNINSTLYLNRWQIWTRVGYRQFPDYYYGHGNRPENLLPNRVRYNSHNAYLTLQPQYNIDKHWSVGASLVAYYDKALTNIPADSLQQVTGQERVSGLNEDLLLLGFGAVGQFDTRNQVYYPSKGLLLKAIYTHYEAPLNTAHRMDKLSIDFRHYVSIYKELIFAYQLKTEMMFGKDIPIQFRSFVGGRDLVRGVRQGMFADDMSIALQGELRFPIYKVLRGTVFAGVGDVYNFQHWDWTIPKVGYGIGLRVAINKAKVNIRFDLARNNLTKSWKEGWSPYLTVKEAF